MIWLTRAADLVFDTVGGDVLTRSPALVRPGGTLVSFPLADAGKAFQAKKDGVPGKVVLVVHDDH
jgi:NADPH:quinone reductase-like Zn-dependent oxidoreductase